MLLDSMITNRGSACSLCIETHAATTTMIEARAERTCDVGATRYRQPSYVMILYPSYTLITDIIILYYCVLTLAV